MVRGRLPEPLLYLSPYFEARRQAYYDALQGVRQQGDLDRWLGLFLDGVRTQAIDAITRAERLIDLRERYRGEVRAATRGIANQVAELRPRTAGSERTGRGGSSRREPPGCPEGPATTRDLGILVEAAAGMRGQLRWGAHEILSVLTDEI